MRENKELDVAIELFNSELEKLKEEKRAQDVVRKAEREKAAAVKELQDAEKNPNISAEEKAAAKDKWIKADENRKRITMHGTGSLRWAGWGDSQMMGCSFPPRC